MRLPLVALLAGLLIALLVAGFPAGAADQAVVASNFAWTPSDVSIGVGEKVTWSNAGGTHNVCVSKPGSAKGTCDEFRNGNPDSDWSAYTNDHAFATAGAYNFVCQQHPVDMTGTVTVGSGGGTTTTSTTATETTPTQTQSTQTQSTQTQAETTQTQTVAADVTAPVFTGKLRRRSSRRSLIVGLGSSEDATLDATVSRRAPGARTFARVGHGSATVHGGRNVVTLPRKASGRLRSGAYKVRLVLVDAAANRSLPRTLEFKLA